MQNLLQMWDLWIGSETKNDASQSIFSSRGYFKQAGIAFTAGLRAHRSLNQFSGFAFQADYSLNNKYSVNITGGISDILKSINNNESTITSASLGPASNPVAKKLGSYQEMMQTLQGSGDIRIPSRINRKNTNARQSRTLKTTSLPGAKNSSVNSYEAAMALQNMSSKKTQSQMNYEDYTKQAMQSSGNQIKLNPYEITQNRINNRRANAPIKKNNQMRSTLSWQKSKKITQRRFSP